MTATQLINDLISVILRDEDIPLEVEGMENPVVIIHDGKIIITEQIDVN